MRCRHCPTCPNPKCLYCRLGHPSREEDLRRGSQWGFQGIRQGPNERHPGYHWRTLGNPPLCNHIWAIAKALVEVAHRICCGYQLIRCVPSICLKSLLSYSSHGFRMLQMALAYAKDVTSISTKPLMVCAITSSLTCFVTAGTRAPLLMP